MPALVSGNTRRAVLAVLSAVLVLLLVPAASSAAGTSVADSGFRPIPNGFSFPNYGNDQGFDNLDANQLERTFGPGICLPGSGRCVLTPVARLYMRALNAGMARGHCFGFATLSELIYHHELSRFGFAKLSALSRGAENTYEAEIERNPVLQRSIARAFAFQNLASVKSGSIEATPRKILAVLRESLESPGGEYWTLAIAKPDLTEGHAITPYAIDSMGRGVYAIRVYDNNWPGELGRRVIVNTRKDTWYYVAGRNRREPGSVYVGDAKTKTLQLWPVRPGLGIQSCPICVGRRGRKSKYNEIRLNGSASEHARVLVTDSRGRKTGFIGNRLVNQIPGARVIPQESGGYRVGPKGHRLYADSLSPVIAVPKNLEFGVSVDGSNLHFTDRETLSLVGPTYDATIEHLVMGPHQIAAVGLSPHGNAIAYKSSRRTRTPVVSLGASAGKAAYRVTVAAVGAPPGAGITFVKQPKHQLMWVGDETLKRRRYRLTILRWTAQGQTRLRRTFTIRGRQQAFLYYGPLSSPSGVAKIVIYSPGKHRHEVRVLPIRREVG